jgi:hypothetical protein
MPYLGILNSRIENEEMLRPLDVVVGLRLSQTPGASYQALAHDLAISPSQSHSSVKRLGAARLVSTIQREVNPRHFLEFLEHGVQYAFPGELLRRSLGIPTAHSGPVLADKIISDDPIVWPSIEGPIEGVGLKPLYSHATKLPEICPSLYELLTVVDAIRVGRVRERHMASDYLRSVLLGNAHRAVLSLGKDHVSAQQSMKSEAEGDT